MKKELKELRREAAKQGWRIEDRKSGATLFYAPDGENIVTAHGTPSDHRSLANLVSEMRKHGFIWKGR